MHNLTPSFFKKEEREGLRIFLFDLIGKKVMKALTSRIAGSLVLLSAAMLCVGCEPQGPAERAGEKIDRAAEKARDIVDPPGPVEKVGREVDRAVNP